MTGRASARVLVVGVGGLGCPAAIVLARAGVGSITLVDDDLVDATNLHRQILFDEADVGRDKTEAAAARLAELVPACRVEARRQRLAPDNAIAMVSSFDLVVEGSDNFATKFLTADACALSRVPVVHASAVRWYGTALAVGVRGCPCYRCLFEDIPSGDAPNCAEAGVMGPVVGVVGAIQADLGLALLDGKHLEGMIATYDGRTDVLRRRRLRARRDCVLCGDKTLRRIDAARYAPPACVSQGE